MAILQDLVRRERPFLEPMGQRLAFQVLHHQEVDAVLVADIVERADVRMAQARNGLGFAVETLARLRIARKMRGQNLDGDDAVKPRIARPVDLAHASGADRRDDLVRAEPGCGREGHRSS